MSEFQLWYRSQETLGARQASRVFGRVHFIESTHLSNRLDRADKVWQMGKGIALSYRRAGAWERIKAGIVFAEAYNALLP